MPNLIVVDTGPLISAAVPAEGERHQLAVTLLESFSGRAIVPWPVFTEADLYFRTRRERGTALRLGRSLLRGDFALTAPTSAELESALDLLERYSTLGIDLPDAVVMAMTMEREARAFTWDFRHFRAVVFGRGETIPLLVSEAAMP